MFNSISAIFCGIMLFLFIFVTSYSLYQNFKYTQKDNQFGYESRIKDTMYTPQGYRYNEYYIKYLEDIKK